jgi:RecG-like helicase
MKIMNDDFHQYIDGSPITEAFLGAIKELGVNSLPQLPIYLPKGYEDYSSKAGRVIDFLNTGTDGFFEARVTRKPNISRNKKPATVLVSMNDGYSDFSGMFFGGAHLWRGVKEGQIVHLSGKITTYNNQLQIKGKLVDKALVGRVTPIYKDLPGKVSSTSIHSAIRYSLTTFPELAVGYICDQVSSYESKIIKNAAPDYGSLLEILKGVHMPKSKAEAYRAMNAIRMIVAYQAVVLSVGSSKKVESPESIIAMPVDNIKKCLSGLPFDLTSDQKSTVWDVAQDLESSISMDRLICGDVGCGKTVSYLIPAACSYMSGKNVVIMMPNLLLAVQVEEEMSSNFPHVKTELMIGGSRRKDKTPDNRVIIGTSAILGWLKDINYDHSIHLLIVDEQQKLGLKQKEILISPTTNFIEATATAIPRTVALVNYGNKKVSYIEERPVVNDIKSYIIGSEYKRRVFNHLKSIVESGDQIAILYPIRTRTDHLYQLIVNSPELISNQLLDTIKELGGTNISSISTLDPENPSDDRASIQFRAKTRSSKKIIDFIEEAIDDATIIESEDDSDLAPCKKNVEDAASKWEEIYPGRVAMVHGGLSTEDKVEAIRRAKAKEVDVIITSSVIEIGLTMPSLRGLYVVDADKYGASTLHQFRGRLARHGGLGYFYMGVSCKISEMNEKSASRLNLLVKFKKGSEIADEDMRQRGFGDLSKKAARQHGNVDGVFHGIKMTPEDVERLIATMSIEKRPAERSSEMSYG